MVSTELTPNSEVIILKTYFICLAGYAGCRAGRVALWYDGFSENPKLSNVELW